MEYTPLAVELLAEDELRNVGEALGRNDGFLVRNGACWLVSESDGQILVGHVDANTSRVFAQQGRWPSPRPQGHGFASPLPDGGLAVATAGLVTAYDADGHVRWTHRLDTWDDPQIASSACTPDGTGHLLLVTAPGPTGNGSYAGDLCLALDIRSGKPVSHTVLPSASAGYVFQQSLTDPGRLLLDAAQGDTFYSLAVRVEAGALHAEPVGLEDEPFAGVNLGTAALKLDVGGEWLGLYRAGLPDVSADAEDVLPEGKRFVGHRPGFLDTTRVLAAVAEEQWSDDAQHLILDALSLQPVGELHYPGTTCLDPLALGDGTWLTIHDDSVRRWRTL
ncbi:hypothetical protein ABT001_35420 [Streptomyces sp. NPDC002793]|uniref:hypothetical protein n=1 Tax=Streptomyces sp. NPDC002793 TaxID=3154432 RepID=UPI0033174B7C